MIRERVAVAVALASILLVACGVQDKAPDPGAVTAQSGSQAQGDPNSGAPQGGQYQASADGLQVNTVKEFKFPGGTFRDGKVTVDPGYKVEPGSQKNVVMLKPASGNGTTFSCFCVLEGGDCWALSTPLPNGDIELTCVAANCSSGQPPFCFQDIGCPDQGLTFRIAVSGMKLANQ